MTETDNIQPEGEKLRKAIRWMSDIIQNQPDKKRSDVLRDAQMRFDLSPKECEFLDKEFC